MNPEAPPKDVPFEVTVRNGNTDPEQKHPPSPQDQLAGHNTVPNLAGAEGKETLDQSLADLSLEGGEETALKNDLDYSKTSDDKEHEPECQVKLVEESTDTSMDIDEGRGQRETSVLSSTYSLDVSATDSDHYESKPLWSTTNHVSKLIIPSTRPQAFRDSSLTWQRPWYVRNPRPLSRHSNLG